MNRCMVRLGTFVSALTLLAACATEQMSRGIYEGSRGYNKSIESTPLEKSKNELPPYDQFKKERDEGKQ